MKKYPRQPRTNQEKRMKKRLIPKRCSMPVYHLETIECFSFLNERFKECPYANCECYKQE